MCYSCKKENTQTCWRSQKWNKLVKVADRSPTGWATVEESLYNDLTSDSDDGKSMRAAKTRALAKKKKSKIEIS